MSLHLSAFSFRRLANILEQVAASQGKGEGVSRDEINEVAPETEKVLPKTNEKTRRQTALKHKETSGGRTMCTRGMC